MINDARLGWKKNNVLKILLAGKESTIHVWAADYLDKISGVMDFPEGNDTPTEYKCLS